MRTQLVDSLLADLLQDVRFLRVYQQHDNAMRYNKINYILYVLSFATKAHDDTENEDEQKDYDDRYDDNKDEINVKISRTLIQGWRTVTDCSDYPVRRQERLAFSFWRFHFT